jgi:hypothetical protein
MFVDVKRIFGLPPDGLSAFASKRQEERDEAIEQSGMALKG